MPRMRRKFCRQLAFANCSLRPYALILQGGFLALSP